MTNALATGVIVLVDVLVPVHPLAPDYTARNPAPRYVPGRPREKMTHQ